MLAVIEDLDAPVPGAADPDQEVGHFTSAIDVRVERIEVLSSSHPIKTNDGLFFERFLFWASSLCWPTNLSPDGVGVSFAELAMSFVFSTGSPMPTWERGLGWSLGTTSTDGITFVLAAAAAAMCACWKTLVQCRAVPGEIRITRVRSLAAYGFQTNSGQASGLSVRPAMPGRVAVSAALRKAFHTGSNRSMLRRSVTFLGPSGLPSHLEG